MLGPGGDIKLVVEELCEEPQSVVLTEGTRGTEKQECSRCSRKAAVSEGEMAGDGIGAGEGGTLGMEANLIQVWALIAY